MSVSVDNRIVQMSFDNGQFERAVKQSMTSLQELDKSIRNAGADTNNKGLTKGFSKIKSNLKLNEISEAIDSIKDRFSTLGIVGMTIIQNLTNTAINYAKRAVSALNNAIFSGGWQRAANLEQANFRLKAMVESADEVKRIMDDVNFAVDGTAFGLDEAAVAASMFAATGMRSGEALRNTLLGIAGMASTAGVGFQQIGDIMVDAAAQGVVMNDTFTRLAMQGIPAAMIMSKKLGISVKDLKDKAKKGEITFEQFAEAMSDKFGKSAKKANETFNGAMSNMLTAFKRITAPFFTSIRNGLRDIFNAGRDAINEIGNNLKILQNLFDDITKKLSKDIVKGIKTLINNLDTFETIALTIHGFFSGLADILLSIRRAFRNVFDQKISDIIAGIVEKLRTLVAIFQWWAMTNHVVEPLFTFFFKAFKTLGVVIQHLINVGKKLYAIFKDISEIFKPLAQFLMGATNGFLKFVEAAIKIIDKIDIFGRIGSLIHSSVSVAQTILDGLLNIIAAFFGAVGKTINESAEKLFDILITVGVLKILGGVRKTIKSFTRTIKQIGGLAKEIRDVGEAIAGIPAAITKLLNEVRKSLIQWQKTLKAAQLALIAGALLMTATALERLSKLSPEELAKGLASISGALGALFAAMKLFDMFLKDSTLASAGSFTEIFDKFLNGGKHTTNLAKEVLSISIAVAILSKAIKTLGELDNEQAARGLISIGIVLGMLVGVCKILQTNALLTDRKRLMSGMTGLIAMAVSAKILSSAVADLAQIKWPKLDNALAAMTLIIGELVGFSLIMGKAKGIGGKSLAVKSFIGFAISMKLMAGALEKMAEVPWGKMQNALVAMGAVLFEISFFMAITEKMSKKGGVQMVLLGAGILILANALKVLASIPFDSMTNAVSALTVLLLELSIAMMVADKFLFGSVALLIAAGAINALVAPLMLLAAVPADKLKTSLKGLALSLGILAAMMVVFSLAAGPMIEGALLLAAASISLAMFAAALMGFGAALTVVGGGITSISVGLLSLWKTISIIVKDIVGALKKIVDFFNRVFGNDLDKTIKKGKKKTKKGGEDITQTFTAALSKSLGTSMKGVMKDFFNSGAKLVEKFKKGLKEKIKNLLKPLTDKLDNAEETIKGYVDGFKNAGESLVDGIIKGIKGKVDSLLSAIGETASSALKKFKDKLGISSPSKEFEKISKWIPIGAAKGVKKYASAFTNSVEELGSNSIDAMRSALNSIDKAIDYTINDNPVITPVLDLSNIYDNAKRIDSVLSRQNAMDINARMTQATLAKTSMDMIVDKLNSFTRQTPNNYFTFNVNGTENPEAFANRVSRQLEMETRAM